MSNKPNPNDILAGSIDDIDDLPGFETPPAGQYILTVNCEVKEVNDKQCVEASFVVEDTVELKNKEDQPPVKGTKFSTLFMLDNEFGVGKLKAFLKPFAQHFGVTAVSELIGEINDLVISAKVTNRKDKEDPDKIYAGVTNIIVS